MLNIKNYRFKELHAGENVIKVLHRNWFYLLTQFLILILMAIVLFAGFFFLPLLFPELMEGEMRSLFLFGEITFILAVWLYGFLVWIDYYFDIWIITDERIINIEQKGLFMRQISEADYTKIQDVTAQIEGFLPTVINYGDVYIQTAAEKERFVFRTISRPYQIEDLLMQLARKKKAKQFESLGEMIQEKAGM